MDVTIRNALMTASPATVKAVVGSFYINPLAPDQYKEYAALMKSKGMPTDAGIALLWSNSLTNVQSTLHVVIVVALSDTPDISSSILKNLLTPAQMKLYPSLYITAQSKYPQFLNSLSGAPTTCTSIYNLIQGGATVNDLQKYVANASTPPPIVGGGRPDFDFDDVSNNTVDKPQPDVDESDTNDDESDAFDKKLKYAKIIVLICVLVFFICLTMAHAQRWIEEIEEKRQTGG